MNCCKFVRNSLKLRDTSLSQALSHGVLDRGTVNPFVVFVLSERLEDRREGTLHRIFDLRGRREEGVTFGILDRLEEDFIQYSGGKVSPGGIWFSFIYGLLCLRVFS